MLLSVSFEALAFCFALLLIASEFIIWHLSRVLKLQAASRPPRLHWFIGFVPVVVLSCQRTDSNFQRFVVRRFATRPIQSIKEFELSLLLGSSSWKLNSYENIYFSFYSVVGKLAVFTIIYALFYYVNRNRFIVRPVSPVWLSRLFGIKKLHRRVRLTEHRQRKGGELKTRWLKASTGRVTDSAHGPR